MGLKSKLDLKSQMYIIETGLGVVYNRGIRRYDVNSQYSNNSFYTKLLRACVRFVYSLITNVRNLLFRSNLIAVFMYNLESYDRDIQNLKVIVTKFHENDYRIIGYKLYRLYGGDLYKFKRIFKKTIKLQTETNNELELVSVAVEGIVSEYDNEGVISLLQL